MAHCDAKRGRAGVECSRSIEFEIRTGRAEGRTAGLDAAAGVTRRVASAGTETLDRGVVDAVFGAVLMVDAPAAPMNKHL